MSKRFSKDTERMRRKQSQNMKKYQKKQMPLFEKYPVSDESQEALDFLWACGSSFRVPGRCMAAAGPYLVDPGDGRNRVSDTGLDGE